MSLEPEQGIAPTKGSSAPKSKEAPKKAPEKPAPGVWVAASAALAVVVAVLASLGIEEDILRRMVRNYPRATGFGISLVILGASIPLVLLLLRTRRSWARKAVRGISIASAAAVVIGLVVVLWTGALSLNSRDMPAVSLSAVKSESGAITITSEATAAALRSREKMLLRIYAYSKSPGQDLPRDCQSGDIPGLEAPSTGARILQWGEAGPDKSGFAKVTETVAVNGDEYSFACAYTVLQNVEEDDNVYFAWSTVDLRTLTYAPAGQKPTASASAAPQQ
jgi:hypothetical protein